MDDNLITADIIAEWLEKNEISVVFGIIGSANAYIFDAISRRSFTKIVYMHHEQALVMAAGAYYRASGKLSVAIVTAGGGSSNAITGVLCNWADSIPCIVISGQESRKYLKEHSSMRMYGTQGFDVVSMVEKITKSSFTLTEPYDIQYSLDKAYDIATADRPGPVWIDIPMDVQSSKIIRNDLKIYKPNIKKSQKLNFENIKYLINESKKPVILAGHGIRLSNSKNIFTNLVNKLQIPILHSWSAIDLLTSDNEFNFGSPGIYGQRAANFIVQNCDLLIVMGSRLALPQTSYNIDNFAPNAKIVMINNDPIELTKHSRYVDTYNCNCKDAIDYLLDSSVDSFRSEWISECKKFKKDFPLIEECHLIDNINYDNSYVFVNNISKLLDDDHVIVIGQGTPLPCCHQALIHKANQIIFASNGLGEMGNGLPSAIGAALSQPERKIILFDGDGSSMMNLQEFQTVVGLDIPLKIVIFNNQGYLFIKHTQKILFGGRYTGVGEKTGVSLPNFEKISEAFGFKYFNSKENSTDEFLKYDKYAVYEIFMNPEQDLVPKVKGIMTNNGFLSPPLEEMSPLLPIDTIRNCINNVNILSYEIRK